MATDSTREIGEILDSREIESLELAQTIYGAQAKKSAEEFGAAIDISPAVREVLVGAVALKLDQLDFEQRREVRDRLRELTALLGGAATGGVVPAPPELVVLPPDAAEQPSPPEPDPPTPPNPDERENDNGKGDPAEIYVLKAPQKNWFTQLYGAEITLYIEALSLDQTKELATKLADIYKELKVTRADTSVRAEQLVAFLTGSVYQEIADQYGVSRESIWQGIRKMSASITKRATQEELLALIPDQERLAGVKDNEPKELSKEQKQWYAALFSDQETLELIQGMNATQQAYLAERLGQNLTPLYIRSQGSEITKIRVSQMVEFLKGTPVDKIGEPLGMTVDGVNDRLRASRESLRTRTDAEFLKLLVVEAKNHKPKEDYDKSGNPES